MRRFFVGPENIGGGTIVIDSRDDLHHMIKVLRLKEGDSVEVSDTVEWEFEGVIESLDEDEAVVRITDKQAFSGEPHTRVTLFQGIPKQGKMEVIVQKCVEMGVSEIVPVFMERTVVVDKGKFGKKIERWNKVSAEAVKQCRRGMIPPVRDAVKMKELLADTTGSGRPDVFEDFDLVLFPYENEKGTTIKDTLLTVTSPMYTEIKGGAPERVAIIIGPEGGFSEAEAEAIVNGGGCSVSLGKTVLRTETAGIAALAMVMYELEL